MNTLYTNRLVLRAFRESDAMDIYKNWTQDERVARYCRWYPHRSISETKDYLKHCMEAKYCWAITEKEKDEVIGCVDVVGTCADGSLEIGYVLSYDYLGKGIMTEAVRGVVDELFSEGIKRICACHAVDHPSSGRVMEKVGMLYVRNDWTQKKFGSDEQCKVKWYEIYK